MNNTIKASTATFALLTVFVLAFIALRGQHSRIAQLEEQVELQSKHYQQQAKEIDLYLTQRDALVSNAKHRGFKVSVGTDYVCLTPPNECIPYCASVSNDEATLVEG